MCRHLSYRYVTELRVSLGCMISVWLPTSSSTGTWPLCDVSETGYRSFRVCWHR